MKKFFRSFVTIITILFLLSPICFASNEVDFKNQIKKEDGSLFEKIKIEQANRVINEEENKNLIKLEDVLKAIRNTKVKKDKIKQKIGF